MRFHQLTMFLAMAEHGSIRGAARALGITQPAVTKAIRMLELEVGLPLVQRNVNGVVLTLHGEALIKHAQILRNQMFHADEAMRARREGGGGVVRIAVSASAAITLLPAVLTRFQAILPRSRVTVLEASVKNTIDGLSDGSLDFAVLPMGDDQLPQHIQLQPLFDICQCVVASAGHPLKDARSLAELRECTWVTPQYPGWGSGSSVPWFWPATIAPPTTVVECGSLAIAQSLLRSLDCMTILPEPTLNECRHSTGIVEVPVQESMPHLSMAILVNSERASTETAASLMTCFVASSEMYMEQREVR
ncbi:LysR substrate-binding domain-containing protein [Paraburkholderia xenovorans]|uniref:LysR substrate-binding domain-containing protein n=1 Tax=Paraburkholderia xenovorans TaxID=36873 RepID=UPI0038B6BD6A